MRTIHFDTYKPYMIKVLTKGKGSKYPKILSTWFMDGPYGEMSYCKTDVGLYRIIDDGFDANERANHDPNAYEFL